MNSIETPSLDALGATAKSSGIAAERIAESCIVFHGDNRIILPHLPSESVHCTITSPPYGDQKNYGSPDEIGSGNNDYMGYLRDFEGILRELQRITVCGGALWLVVDTLKRRGHSIPLPFHAIDLAQRAGWSFQECVVWDKGKSLPWSHAGHFRSVFEYVLLLSKGPFRHFDLDSVREADHLSSYWVKYPERFSPMGKSTTDIWHVPIPVQGSWSKTDLRHLCPFPNDLVRRMVALTTKPGDVVLDPFAGTGVVPAVASAMGRLGAGIELNDRYFNAIKKSGYRRIVKEAKAEFNEVGVMPESLSRLIMRLRMLKYPRTLFAQLSRPDRLGDRSRRLISAFIVNEHPIKDSPEKRPGIVIEVLAARAADIARIESESLAVNCIAPLSKFGIDATIKVLKPSVWKAESFKGRPSGAQWYLYKAGKFNYYDVQVTAGKLAPTLAAVALGNKTRVPPIFSRIGVRVASGIHD